MAKKIVNKNGTKNADTIEITASNLTIKAGKGNDKITLTKGKKNTVYGEAGNDTVTVNGGSSNLYGGAGNDVYVIGKSSIGKAEVKDFSVKKGNTDSVKISGGTVKSIGVSGSDVIVKGGKSAALTLQNAKNKTFTVTDTLGNYTVYGSNVKLALGKNYKGTLTAASFITTVDARNNANAIKIKGNATKNTIYGGAGANTIYGYGSNDTLNGGAGNDTLYGGVGTDKLTGGTGRDTFVYANGDGKDTITDYTAGQDTLQISSGSIGKTVLANSNKDLVFTVGSGTVTLTGAATKAISLKDSRGSYTTSNTAITLGSDFTGTMDAIKYLSTVKSIDGSAATKVVNITGNAQANVIKAGKVGGTYKGEAGNDTLYGGAGNDTLYGGVGNDTINAGKGTNTLYFAKGDGTDTVLSGGGTDTLVFSSEANINNVKAAYSNNDLKITYTGGTVILKDYKNGSHSVKNFKVGSTTKTIESILPNPNPGPGPDPGPGSAPEPKYLKVSGYSIIQGTDAADNLTGTTGKDRIFGSGGNDTLHGGTRYDYLLDGDYLYGGAGDDAITGGAGNDLLYGGSGANKFFFNTGDGQDVMLEDGVDNTLVFNTVSDLSQLTITAVPGTGMGNYSNYDLVIGYGNNDSVTVKNFLSPDQHDFSGYKLQAGANGVAKSLYEIVDTIDDIKQKTTLNDNYRPSIKSMSTGEAQLGNQINNVITGRTVQDDDADPDKLQYIFAYDGDDTITANNSTVYAGNGNDVITYGEADAYGQNGDDTLYANGSWGYGGNGNDTFYGIGSMTGGTGDDRFYMQGSSTELSGTKHFSVTTGSGNDYVDAGGVGSLVENDTISVTTGEGVNTVVVDGTKKVNIILGIAKTYREDFEPEDVSQSQKLIESNVGSYDFNIHYTAYEKDGDLFVVSNRGGDQTEEYVNGIVKNDGVGAGVTIIKGYSSLSADQKNNITVTFLPSDPYVNNSAVYPHKDGGAIMETYTLSEFLDNIVGNTDEIYTTLEGFQDTQTYTAQWFNTIDNTADSETTVAGTNSADLILGGASAQTINGGAGNDVIYANDFGSHNSEGKYVESGKAIQTVINGEAGNDYIIGSMGKDIIDGGTGRDYIDGGSGNDVLTGGSVETFENSTANARFNWDEIHGGAGNDEIYSVNATESYQGGEIYFKNDIYGEDGDDVIVANGYNDHVEGGKGSDTIRTYHEYNNNAAIHGNEGDDRIEVKLTGSELVYGDEGNDVIDASLSSGNHKLYGGSGSDTISGGSGDEWIEGGAGDDIIEGGAGNDVIYGSDYGASQPSESDTIHGGAGNDVIYAGGTSKVYGDAGNDTIYFGNGIWNEPSNLLIDGGAGNDTYIYNGYNGYDAIVASEGNDTVKFANYKSATHSKDGDDLVITYTPNSNNTSALTFKDYYAGGFDNFTIQTYSDESGQAITGQYTVSQFLDELDGNSPYVTNGTAGDDLIRSAGDINGLGGNDFIMAVGDGEQAINTGSGDNTVVAQANSAAITGGTGNDAYTLSNSSGTNTIVDEGGDNTIYVTQSNMHNTITLNGDGNNTITTAEGTYGSSFTITATGSGKQNIDILSAFSYEYESSVTTGSGDDSISISYGTVTTGAGNDTLEIKMYGEAVLKGGEGNDTYVVNSGYYDDDSQKTSIKANALIEDTQGTNTIKFSPGIVTHNDLSIMLNVTEDGVLAKFQHCSEDTLIDCEYDSVITNRDDTKWNKYNAYGYGNSALKDGLRVNGMDTVARIEAGDGYYISEATIRSAITDAKNWLKADGRNYGSVVEALNDNTNAENNYDALYGIFNNENTWTQGTQVFGSKD